LQHGKGHYKVWYQGQLIKYRSGDFFFKHNITIDPEDVCMGSVGRLAIDTDKFGIENNWEMRDNNGELIKVGGPYPGGEKIVDEYICINEDNEKMPYTFTMFDHHGDGMCCNFGNGHFKYYQDDVTIFSSDGKFGKSITFNTDGKLVSKD
jgi:hypothetical protein